MQANRRVLDGANYGYVLGLIYPIRLLLPFTRYPNGRSHSESAESRSLLLSRCAPLSS
jgi:hypothetical protein